MSTHLWLYVPCSCPHSPMVWVPRCYSRPFYLQAMCLPCKMSMRHRKHCAWRTRCSSVHDAPNQTLPPLQFQSKMRVSKQIHQELGLPRTMTSETTFDVPRLPTLAQRAHSFAFATQKKKCWRQAHAKRGSRLQTVFEVKHLSHMSLDVAPKTDVWAPVKADLPTAWAKWYAYSSQVRAV